MSTAEERLTLSEFLEKMDEVYGDKSPSVRRTEFFTLKQGPRQTPKMFAQEIANKGILAFGKWEDSLGELAIRIFLEGLTDQAMSQYVRLKEPHSLAQAANLSHRWRDNTSGTVGTLSALYGGHGSEKSASHLGRCSCMQVPDTNSPVVLSEALLVSETSSDSTEEQVLADYAAFRTWMKGNRSQKKTVDPAPTKKNPGAFSKAPRKAWPCFLCGDEDHRVARCPLKKTLWGKLKALAEKETGADLAKLEVKPENASGPQ